MNPEAVYVACAIWAVFGLWRVGTALHAIAAAVKVAMPREAQARRDAALVARIERAYCRSHGIDGWERNGRARIARRRYLAGLGYSV